MRWRVQPQQGDDPGRHRRAREGHRRGRCLAAKQRAEEALANSTDKIDQAEALAELLQATEQLRLLEKLRKIRN